MQVCISDRCKPHDDTLILTDSDLPVRRGFCVLAFPTSYLRSHHGDRSSLNKKWKFEQLNYCSQRGFHLAPVEELNDIKMRGKQWWPGDPTGLPSIVKHSQHLVQKRQYLNSAATGSKCNAVDQRQRRNANSFYLHGRHNGSAIILGKLHVCF